MISYKNNMKIQLNRIVLYVIGLCILCVGVVLNTKTNIGVAAINAMPYVVANSSKISLGTAIFVLYTIMVLIQWYVTKQLNIQLILQLPVSLLFGKMVDFTNTYIFVFELQSPSLGYVLLFVAILLVALGTTLVVSQDIIPNAPDGCVNALASYFNVSFGKMKVRFDAICIIIAFTLSLILQGKIIGIGIGTIFSMLLTGTCCNAFKKIINTTLK